MFFPFILFGLFFLPFQIHAQDSSINELDVSFQKMAFSNAQSEEAYDSDEEYRVHQKTSNRFFRRLTNKPALRKIIREFKENIANEKPLSPINLDGLSSRTRILLFRELTAQALVLNTFTLSFVFHAKEFEIRLKPNLRQPGNGIINVIGTYKSVFDILNIYSSDYQKNIAKKLREARKNKQDYQIQIPYPILTKENEILDLEILNILLDFEVARRLQGTEKEEGNSFFAKEIERSAYCLEHVVDSIKKGESCCEDEESIRKADRITELFRPLQAFISNLRKNQETNIKGAKKEFHYLKPEKMADKIWYIENDKDSYDATPVASAIVQALKLSADSPTFDRFFHAPSIRMIGNHRFPYGDFNAFEGLPTHRMQAVKNIIKKNKNSSLEEIHKEYLDIFGGESESEGEEYNEDEESEESEESEED